MAIQLEPTQLTDILAMVFFIVLTIALLYGGTHRKIWSVQDGALVKVYANDLVLLSAVLPAACLSLYYTALAFDISFLEPASLARLLWFRLNLILLVALISAFLFNGRLARGLGALVTKWKVLQSSLLSVLPSPPSQWQR